MVRRAWVRVGNGRMGLTRTHLDFQDEEKKLWSVMVGGVGVAGYDAIDRVSREYRRRRGGQLPYRYKILPQDANSIPYTRA